MDSKRVCIAIDTWKLKYFEETLTKYGYKWKRGKGLTPDTLHLYVQTYDVGKLQRVVGMCQQRAATSKEKP